MSLPPQNCNLGQHVPLEKGVGRGGLLSLPLSSDSSPASSEGEGKTKEGKESVTADSKTSTRHGPPAPPASTTTTSSSSSSSSSPQVDLLCKKLLGKWWCIDLEIHNFRC